MSLSSNHLDAFLEVAREKSFSLAAKKLHITQSALSQRVLNLEHEIGSTLFVRESSGVRLTDLGQKLLRYCQAKESLENEFLTKLRSKDARSLSGLVRIGGFSTITRSVLMPLIALLVKEHPQLQVEIRNAELRELPEMLSTGIVDFIFTNAPIEKAGVETELLGYEENVLIQSTLKTARNDVYLDHDAEDSTTHDFLKSQGRKVPTIQRNYLGEIYSIIDGVRLGLGRAVVPLHLTLELKGVSVVPGYKSQKVPVYFSYYSQSFYTDLQKLLIDRLKTEVSHALGGN